MAGPLLTAVSCLLATPALLLGQVENSPLARASRASLDSLAARYDLAAQSPAYSEELRAEAQRHREAIRTRLTQGDFQSGDRVEIRVEEHPELSDTLNVQGELELLLPGVGTVPLAGVLRSELEERLHTAVARIIRNPRLQATSFVRVSLSGAFNAPGFYLVDADLPLSELIMRGGGQARDADMDHARIERAGEVVMSTSDFQQALVAGTTIEQLGLREGDSVVIPPERSWFSSAREWIFILPSLVGLLAIFR